MLNLYKANGSLAKDPAKVQGMFSDHFQSIFAPYALTNSLHVVRDACCRVVPCKFANGDSWIRIV